jgi:MFS family permease
LVWSLVTWLTTYAKSFSVLLVTRAVMGVSEACYQPASNALITDYHPGPTRSTATGINVSGVIIGSALGGFGGLLADAYGWRAPFSIFGLVGITYSAVLLVLLRDVRGPKAGTAPEDGLAPESIWKAARCLFGNFGFILAVVYWGLGGIMAWSIIGWMPTYMQEHFHLTQGKAGIVSTACTQASAFLGVLVGGPWADRWSLSNPRARMLVTSIGMGLAAPGVILATHPSIFVAAMAGLAIFGFLSAFSDVKGWRAVAVRFDHVLHQTAAGRMNLRRSGAGRDASWRGRGTSLGDSL